MSSFHRGSLGQDIFIFATPRGGSTWFMEMIWSQKGFKICSEPFDPRNPIVRRHLNVNSFVDIFNCEGVDRKFSEYIEAIRSNKIRSFNPNPLRKNYRPLTTRIVFKLIHASFDLASSLAQKSLSPLLFVIRHPIPTSLSREVFPLLGCIEKTNYIERFSHQEQRLIAEVNARGNHLEMGVVAWCIHNKFAFVESNKLITVSYEQAVLDPTTVINVMCERLGLDDRTRMLCQSMKASAVRKKSSIERQKLLSDRTDRSRLIDSWRTKVSPEEESRVMKYLDVFEIDAYRFGQSEPQKKFFL